MLLDHSQTKGYAQQVENSTIHVNVNHASLATVNFARLAQVQWLQQGCKR